VALKACKECRKEISTDANPCPHCGKKSPHGTSPIVKLAIGSLGFVLLLGMCGGRDKSEGSSSTSSSIAQAKEQPALAVAPIEITARELERAYDANEVAADNAYKGRVLAVSGNVSSIDKGIFDEVIVRLAAGSPYDSVLATMNASEAGTAAALRKGAHVTVRCVGKGMTIGSPVLGGCFFAPSASQEESGSSPWWLPPPAARP
jgi:hypothetical protein